MGAKSESADLTLKVVVRREGEHWVVHALEHEFAAHGPTRDAALHALARTIIARMKAALSTVDPLGDVPPAPMEYWDDWERAPYREEPRRIIASGHGYPGAFVEQAVFDSQSSR